MRPRRVERPTFGFGVDAFETDKLGEQDTIQVRVGQALRAEASEFETTKTGVRSEVPFLLCRKSRLI